MRLSDSVSKNPQEPRLYQLEDMEATTPPEKRPKPKPKPKPEKRRKLGLKDNKFHPLFSKVVEEDPRETAQKQAQTITQQAEETLLKAKDDAQTMRKKAYEEGYDQGQKEGKQACQIKVDASLDNLKRAVSALDKIHNDILAGMESENTALVLAVLDKIFMHKDAFPAQLIQEVVKESVKRLMEEERLTIRLSKTDIGFVEDIKPQLLDLSEDIKNIKLVSDDKLHPGDCIVEGPVSQVDATLETRRKRVLAVLEDCFHQADTLDLSSALKKANQSEDTSGDSMDADLEDW